MVVDQRFQAVTISEPRHSTASPIPTQRTASSPGSAVTTHGWSFVPQAGVAGAVSEGSGDALDGEVDGEDDESAEEESVGDGSGVGVPEEDPGDGEAEAEPDGDVAGSSADQAEDGSNSTAKAEKVTHASVTNQRRMTSKGVGAFWVASLWC